MIIPYARTDGGAVALTSFMVVTAIGLLEVKPNRSVEMPGRLSMGSERKR